MLNCLNIRPLGLFEQFLLIWTISRANPFLFFLKFFLNLPRISRFLPEVFIFGGLNQTEDNSLLHCII